MKKILFLVLVSAAPAAITALFAIPLLGRPDTTPDITTSIITVERIREVGLQAGVVQMPQHATITIAKPAKVLNFEIGQSSLLYQAVGSVEAAVNLLDLNDGDVVTTESGTTITLPTPVLTKVWIDPENSVVLDRQQAFVFAPDHKHFQSDAEREAAKRFAATACSNGILKKSADTAKTSLLSLVSKLNVANVRVEVRPSTKCSLKETPNV